jgi:alkylation response protein AidB-like acyl-CoA dehydrogenase
MPAGDTAGDYSPVSAPLDRDCNLLQVHIMSGVSAVTACLKSTFETRLCSARAAEAATERLARALQRHPLQGVEKPHVLRRYHAERELRALTS